MLSLQRLVSRERVRPLEPVLGSLACVAIPTLIRALLMPALGPTLPFSVYFPAVLLATVLWGLWWGTAVLIGSGIAAAVLFMQPLDHGFDGTRFSATLGLLLFSGFVILVTGNTLRRAMIGLTIAQKADQVRKRELQHRLKNTLAVVESFSSYLSRRTSDKAEFERLLGAKIAALAKASDIMFADRFESCALPETAVAALAPFTQQGRISISGPSAQLDVNACEPLVLALHELATNAHKYGALSVESGRVDLSWQIDASHKPVCKIRWVESDGPLVQPPSRRGLGQYLLKAQKGLASVDIRYAPTGVVCEIAVYLSEASERTSKAPPAAINIETG